MKTRLFIILSAGLCCAAAGGAFAADLQAQPLRHLTFDVRYDVTSKIETKVSGFGGSSGNAGTIANAGPASEKRGTISVDIVAATADGGLVADVTEDAERHEPPLRVGITDKALFYDHNAQLTDEERTLLHYLARDFVKANELAPATIWKDDSDAAGVTNHLTYEVKTVDADTKTIALEISGTSSASGLGAFQATTNGSMSYDTGTLVPTKLYLATRTTIQSGTRLTIVDSTLTSTLRDDSFHKN